MTSLLMSAELESPSPRGLAEAGASQRVAFPESASRLPRVSESPSPSQRVAFPESAGSRLSPARAALNLAGPRTQSAAEQGAFVTALGDATGARMSALLGRAGAGRSVRPQESRADRLAGQLTHNAAPHSISSAARQRAAFQSS